MFRGDAAQHYPVLRATWGLSVQNNYSAQILCLAIEAEERDSTFPEEDGWPHQPFWRIDVWVKDLNSSMLRKGSVFRIPNCFDEFTGVVYTTFFYDEHDYTEDNRVTVVESSETILQLSLEGYIRYENASMRPTKITAEASFQRLTPHEPIGAAFFREALPPLPAPYGATFHPSNET